MGTVEFRPIGHAVPRVEVLGMIVDPKGDRRSITGALGIDGPNCQNRTCLLHDVWNGDLAPDAFRCDVAQRPQPGKPTRRE